MREVVGHPEEASAEKTVPRKLSDERRQKLLAHFKTPRLAPKQLFWLKRIEVRPVFTALVALAIIAVLAALLLPALASAKKRAQGIRRVSMAKQKEWKDEFRQMKILRPVRVLPRCLLHSRRFHRPNTAALAVTPPPPEIVLPKPEPA